MLKASGAICISFFDKTIRIDRSNRTEGCVINLSVHKLTESEKSIILKGLKFWPTPGEPNLHDINSECAQQHSVVKNKHSQTVQKEASWILQFLPTTNPETPNPNLKPKSTWEPIRDLVLETFFKLIEEDVNKFIPRAARV